MPVEQGWADTVVLRTGLTSVEVAEEGMRQVRLDGVTVVSNIYAAVRGADWATLPTSRLAGDSVDVNGDDMLLTRDQMVADLMRSRLTVRVAANGIVTITNRLEVLADCQVNRWGLNVCFSAFQYLGAALSAGQSTISLSEQIHPQRAVDGVVRGMLPPQDSVRVLRGDGGGFSLCSSGQQLEVEDQRNWTDPTYKVYSGSLQDPRPRCLVPGQILEQTLVMKSIAVARAAPHCQVREAVTVGAEQPLLHIGVQLNDLPHALSDDQLGDLVADLGVDHVRVDVEPRPGELSGLHDVGVPLEVAALLPDLEPQSLDALTACLADTRLARVLIHLSDRRSTGDEAVEAFETSQRARGTHSRGLVAFPGTDVYFADLNRDWPRLAQRRVSFGIVPTVHLGSTEALFGTLPVQQSVVVAARHWADEVVISPISLRPRGTPEVAGSPAHARRACGHEHIDERQHSLECGSWTLGSLYHLTLAGASSGTWYELLGPRGMVEQRGSKFLLSPAFHVISALGAARRPAVQPVSACDGGILGLYLPASRKLLLGSTRPWPQTLPDSPVLHDLERRCRLRHRDVVDAALVREWWCLATEPLALEAPVVLEPFELTVLTREG